MKQLFKFISEAEYEATKSPMKHKYGCVLIYHGKIISKGHNYYILNSNSLYSIHAEKDCISKVTSKDILSKCILIVVRIGSTDCKCCSSCQKLIDKYNIKLKC